MITMQRLSRLVLAASAVTSLFAGVTAICDGAERRQRERAALDAEQLLLVEFHAHTTRSVVELLPHAH